MNRIFAILIITLISINCKPKEETAVFPESLTAYVNTFVGTGGHGHTYPGATMPFGMMQLSPDTRLEGWDGCSGYHYDDKTIYGFSHTHLSGTGVSDYGDVLLMPTNKAQLNNGADGKPGYKSSFSHGKEKASPGYYEVHLDDTNIDVRLTVTQRAGIHEYTFPNATNQFLILDLEHRDELLEHKMNFVSNTEVSGYRFSKAWATNQKLFYYMRFSKPIKNWEKTTDTLYPTKKAIEFDNPTNEPIYVRIGISPVDEAGAQLNLDTEIGNADFETIRLDADGAWEKQLSKIVIEDDNLENMQNFYTALYHTMIAPNIYQDVDGRYRGMDLEIHETKDFDYYTVFSLWDTYRAAHPLYTIIEEKRTNDFVNTMVAKYDEGGILPIWDLSANYTGCMIGYHAAPVIADAYMKGIRNYDPVKALEAIKHSASQDKLGLEHYKNVGFIPVELESESVSKTLEYAYDDWTIAQMAKELEKTEDYTNYIARAQYYKNLYNPATGFMQGRINNTWFSPFDPFEVNFNYTEANAWQYSLYAPQDISGHIALMGGDSKYESHLDKLFSTKTTTSGRNQADITGLIGQYAHGNEPSHHMAYLYNFIGKPNKTQEKVYDILTTLYHNKPDGISGNEDCGQMSAWFVMSALGFYPVTPASNQYIIGTPLFKKATITLENGKKFVIEKKGAGKYIASAKANSQPLYNSYINHNLIKNGGNLSFTMIDKPSKWASKKVHRPVISIIDNKITATPYIAEGSIAFATNTTIHLKSIDEDATIFYALNGANFKPYTQPFVLDKPDLLNVYAICNDVVSKTISTQFFKYDENYKLTLKHNYANEYSAGGNNALINGRIGTLDYRCGAWQGSQDPYLETLLDLGKIKNIKSVSVNFLKDQRSWIFYPKQVTLEFLNDNKEVIQSKTLDLPVSTQEESTTIYAAQFQLPRVINARFVRMKVKAQGLLPQWHLGYESNGVAWTFIDEITVK